jgi:AcrR family transcriptional regulator
MLSADLQSRERPLDEAPARRIVAAARRYFFTHGFRGVTMDDLAAELGMSKKTLYAHFPSKTALVEAVLLDKFAEIEATLQKITAQAAADFAGALHRYLAAIQQHTEEIQPSFLRDLQRETPELFALIEARRRQIVQRYFGKLLGDGRKAGMIRKDIPVNLVLEILLGAAQAIMIPSKMAELGVTPQTGPTSIITVVLEGVLTEKGRASS